MATSPEEGLEKSATLLIALGEDRAAEVLKHLGPREVQKIGHAMASLKSVPRAKVEGILDEFLQASEEHAAVHVDTDNYVRSVLTKALGDDKASNLISRILQTGETSGIEGLKWMDAATVADLIKNEHPQIISTILVHLEHDHASEILNHFTERLRNDVVLRIATLEGIQPAALRELNEAMMRAIGLAVRGNDAVGVGQVGGHGIETHRLRRHGAGRNLEYVEQTHLSSLRRCLKPGHCGYP